MVRRGVEGGGVRVWGGSGRVRGKSKKKDERGS